MPHATATSTSTNPLNLSPAEFAQLTTKKKTGIHPKTQSRLNLAQLKREVGPLNSQQQTLFNTICNTAFTLGHSTPYSKKIIKAGAIVPHGIRQRATEEKLPRHTTPHFGENNYTYWTLGIGTPRPASFMNPNDTFFIDLNKLKRSKPEIYQYTLADAHWATFKSGGSFREITLGKTLFTVTHDQATDPDTGQIILRRLYHFTPRKGKPKILIKPLGHELGMGEELLPVLAYNLIQKLELTDVSYKGPIYAKATSPEVVQQLMRIFYDVELMEVRIAKAIPFDNKEPKNTPYIQLKQLPKPAISQLHKAVSAQDEALVSKLLSHPETDIDAQNPEGKTALVLAAELGNLKIIYLLLGHGANPDVTQRAFFDSISFMRHFVSVGSNQAVTSLFKEGYTIHALPNTRTYPRGSTGLLLPFAIKNPLLTFDTIQLIAKKTTTKGSRHLVDAAIWTLLSKKLNLKQQLAHIDLLITYGLNVNVLPLGYSLPALSPLSMMSTVAIFIDRLPVSTELTPEHHAIFKAFVNAGINIYKPIKDEKSLLQLANENRLPTEMKHAIIRQHKTQSKKLSQVKIEPVINLKKVNVGITLVISEDGELFLGSREADRKFGNDKLHFPGGLIDGSLAYEYPTEEELVYGAKRELEEETLVDINVLIKKGLATFKHLTRLDFEGVKKHWTYGIYLVKVKNAVKHLFSSSDDFVDGHWVPLNQITGKKNAARTDIIQFTTGAALRLYWAHQDYYYGKKQVQSSNAWLATIAGEVVSGKVQWLPEHTLTLQTFLLYEAEGGALRERQYELNKYNELMKNPALKNTQLENVKALMASMLASQKVSEDTKTSLPEIGQILIKAMGLIEPRLPNWISGIQNDRGAFEHWSLSQIIQSRTEDSENNPCNVH